MAFIYLMLNYSVKYKNVKKYPQKGIEKWLTSCFFVGKKTLRPINSHGDSLRDSILTVQRNCN